MNDQECLNEFATKFLKSGNGYPVSMQDLRSVITKNDGSNVTSLFSEESLSNLEHHGVDGQKWRVRRGPPYPLDREAKEKDPSNMKANTPPGTATKEANKTAERKAEKTRKREERKAKSKEKDEVRKAKDLEKKKKKYSRDPKTLYKYRDMFTYEEISDALRKFEWEARLKDYADKDFRRAKDRVATFRDMSSSIVSIANNAIGGYNVIAKLNNTFNENGKKMKLIEPNKNEDKPKTQDKEKK